MITIRKSDDRGHADHGWLNTYHTFSFANYYDPSHMGYRSLRVLNDDRVAAGRGFGSHGHRDMEILTYVLEGSLTHRDSMGQRQTFGANTIQSMSAGTGVVHSEFNSSATEPVHFLQIWIEPRVMDVEPSYQQVTFDAKEKSGRFRLLAGPEADPKEPAVVIHQDALIHVATLNPSEKLERSVDPQRHAYVQVARGSITLNGQVLNEGDSAAVSGEPVLSFTGNGPDGSEFLVFDLA